MHKKSPQIGVIFAIDLAYILCYNYQSIVVTKNQKNWNGGVINGKEKPQV